MYAYCNNNPVMYTDPSGRDVWEDIFNWIVRAVVIVFVGLPFFVAKVFQLESTWNLLNGISNMLGGFDWVLPETISFIDRLTNADFDNSPFMQIIRGIERLLPGAEEIGKAVDFFRSLFAEDSWIVKIIDFLRQQIHGQKETDLDRRRKEWQEDHDMRDKFIQLLKVDDRFTKVAWLVLTTDGDRETLLANLFNVVKDEMNLSSSVSIRFFTDNNSDERAYYTHPGSPDGITVPPKTVMINRKFFNDFPLDEIPWASSLMLNTIIHECRHAYQWEAIDGINDHIVSELTLSYWRDNNLPGHYKGRDQGALAYASQPIEYDAFIFSNEYPMVLYNADIEYEGSWKRGVDGKFVRP